MLLAIDYDNYFTVKKDISIACEKYTEMLVSIAQQCTPQKYIWVRPYLVTKQAWRQPLENYLGSVKGYIRRPRGQEVQITLIV